MPVGVGVAGVGGGDGDGGRELQISLALEPSLSPRRVVRKSLVLKVNRRKQ
jgi:hypothetical protein